VGLAQNFKQIILEPNDTPDKGSTKMLPVTPSQPHKSSSPPDSDNSSESESVSELEIEELLEKVPVAPPPPPDLPITHSHPKHNVHMPICNNNAYYTMSSYGTCKRPTKRTTVIHDTTSDPRTYAKAMAHPNTTKWGLAYNEEKQIFEHIGVYKAVPHPTD
jgi:hypothetical protein